MSGIHQKISRHAEKQDNMICNEINQSINDTIIELLDKGILYSNYLNCISYAQEIKSWKKKA